MNSHAGASSHRHRQQHWMIHWSKQHHQGSFFIFPYRNEYIRERFTAFTASQQPTFTGARIGRQIPEDVSTCES